MDYVFETSSNEYWVINLKFQEKNSRLTWDTNPGGLTLLLQGDYDEEFLNRKRELCEKLGELDLEELHKEFQPLAPELPGISARLINAREKAQLGGCPVSRGVNSYLILACLINREECRIFEPKQLKKQRTQLSSEVTLVCRKVYDFIPVGVFGRKTREEFAGFYEVKPEKEPPVTYQDGEFYYESSGIRIPIPKAALEQGFYVKADVMPEIVSGHPGYRLSMKVKD